MSPYYDIEDPNDLYIDEKDAIEVPPIDANEPVSDFQKKYYMGASNLPYQLERPQGLQYNGGEVQGGKFDRKAPKLNRYYEKLRPYYKIKEENFTTDKTLIFESRFESGNLKKAIKV